MSHTRYTAHEIVERGKAIYEQQIRPKVEAENVGRFLVIDIETGSYEMDESSLAASDRAAAKRPSAALFTMRVGYPTAFRLGGRIVRKP